MTLITKFMTTCILLFSMISTTFAGTKLEEQSEGSFLALKVSTLAEEYHEVARINRTRHKNLCFQLGALAEKARGVAAYVQQAAFTNSRVGGFGLEASVTNAGQELNTASDEIQSFCEAVGEDQRSTLLPSLKKLKKAADLVAQKI